MCIIILVLQLVGLYSSQRSRSRSVHSPLFVFHRHSLEAKRSHSAFFIESFSTAFPGDSFESFHPHPWQRADTIGTTCTTHSYGSGHFLVPRLTYCVTGETAGTCHVGQRILLSTEMPTEVCTACQRNLRFAKKVGGQFFCLAADPTDWAWRLH